MKKQIICIRWGTKYGVEYVNRLHAGIKRHITPPFTFHCITDDPTGLDDGIQHIPLPDLGCEMPTGTFGIWGKSRLWAERLGDLEGPVLFIDLDSVITGPMDGFFEHGDPEAIIAARNPNRPHERMGQTSIFRYPVGKLAPIREKFLADPQGVAAEYGFEQRYVTKNAPGGIQFWPRGWVAVFRWHCIWPTPLNYLFTPRKPKAARVVIFPGRLDVPDAIAGRWGTRYPVRTRAEYIKAMFKPRKGNREYLWGHIRHFLRPAPWVAKAWYGEDDPKP